MSFGQALFFGVGGLQRRAVRAATSASRPSSSCCRRHADRPCLALLLGGFLLLGRYPPSTIFVALGTLTGSYAADRLARGWYYLGGQNGIPSIPPLSSAATRSSKGRSTTTWRSASSLLVYLLCRWLVRSQFGLVLAGIRQHEERIAFFGYRVQHFKAIIFALRRRDRGPRRALSAFHEGFVWPNMLGVVLSTQVVLYVPVRRLGTLVGAVIGTVAIEYVSFCPVEQLSGHLADHPRPLAAARRPLPSRRPDRPHPRSASASAASAGRRQAAAEADGAARGRGA